MSRTKEMKNKPDPFKKYRVSVKKALTMNPETFVKNYLFPFMRRESGNGFAMADWIRDVRHSFMVDGVERDAPACGTAACIGGSMELILGTESRREIAAVLGLPHYATYSLFFNWGFDIGGNSWPADLARAFSKATTPMEKEQVAEEVVLRAIETGGTCFLREL